MNKAAIASSTQISADAGAEIIRAGGNAVDAAIAASLVAIVTEPGICSLGCGGFITLWPTDGEPTTYDGNIEMPGRGVARDRLGKGAWEVTMDYGGGVSTFVGHGAVGTPGGLAAYDSAWRDHGSLEWSELFTPAINYARNGFPLSPASHNYLRYSHECVYGWLPQSRTPLHHEDGSLKTVGHKVTIGELADSLERIATHGTADFYRGALANIIAEDSMENGGVLTLRDLAEYEVIKRKPFQLQLEEWNLATNPAPAVGGATLIAMLTLLKQQNYCRWSTSETAKLADIQHRVLMHRYQHLDYSDDLDTDINTLLSLAGKDAITLNNNAPSTVHTSVVDNDGLACAITMSSGYGAGVMPPGTGIWMNNCLGEIELNRKGLNAGPPGMRLASNMAPTVAAHANGQKLAIGSPGADRITSALLCTLNNFVGLGMPLDQAIAHPRLHLEINDGDPRIAFEQQLDTELVSLPTRDFAEPSMFFGGVGAAMLDAEGELTAAADPRRAGGHVVV